MNDKWLKLTITKEFKWKYLKYLHIFQQLLLKMSGQITTAISIVISNINLPKFLLDRLPFCQELFILLEVIWLTIPLPLQFN